MASKALVKLIIMLFIMLSLLPYQFKSKSDSKNADDQANRSEPALPARLEHNVSQW